MICKTELEWLRAKWMQHHGCARQSDVDFEQFVTPDLTAEEIRDCPFEDLGDPIEFVRPVKLIDGEVLTAMAKTHPIESAIWQAMVARGEARIVWTREVST